MEASSQRKTCYPRRSRFGHIFDIFVGVPWSSSIETAGSGGARLRELGPVSHSFTDRQVMG